MAVGGRYAGKVVLVTGGGRGIGAGIVRAFAQSGAQVVFCDKDESGSQALVQELPGTVFMPCDVTREEEVGALIADTLHRFGHLDCVVNNAGYHPPPQWPEETSAQSFRQLLELNLLATYTLTKGAVTAMTKALALDESQYGVRVNCISPGNIWTPLWEELAASTPDPEATIQEGTMAQPLGRMGQPAEVGAAALFLASEASFCTGLELLVTGGAELGYGCKASHRTPVG
ncbi:17-beta-hydroxysteroid dehydrogenase 14 isoform X3 [Perognathus longimembris pacificus]|uniref:17-beta-hydroxysteroid dehydrogenase 14 isoform X3 n=1 Tax=Perognathus longimembris pacificus TaxID=214514 RepID=UPI002019DD9D|nr:17-beta-hydroxysteroid dehydrogenase 14 isoform X3 [Perognathus longimembris pacificus]